MVGASLEIIARAVIVREGRILVARDRGQPWYFLPGGHVESGEPVELALVRELDEELGSPATITGFVGVVEYAYTADAASHRELNLIFEANLDAAEPISHEEHLEFTWVPLDGLAEIALRPETLKIAMREWVENDRPFWRPWNRAVAG